MLDGEEIKAAYLHGIADFAKVMAKQNYTDRANDVGRILRTFKIKKNVEVTDNGKIII